MTPALSTPRNGPVWAVHLLTSRAEPPGAGGQVVFLADVDTQLLGHEPAWARVAVVKHTSRSELATSTAESAECIVMTGVPFDSPPLPPDAPDWAEVPHPPTEDDPAVVVLHVLRYKEGEERQQMATYTDHASRIAVPHGVRIAGWFEVDATIVGDGREWDQARFNAFPSKEAFMAVVFDPARLEAQREHREAAIADTYTMILRPTLDRLADSQDP